MRSISLPRNLKAFIFRCLLLWPRVFRSLRKIWSWFFQTNPSSRDGKKTEQNVEGPSSSAILWERKEHSVVCASLAFEGVGDPSQRHSISRSNDAGESIQLSPVIERSPSVPHSLSSYYTPSSQGPQQHPHHPLPTGNPYLLSSPSRAETPHSTMELIIHRSNTPVSWTHPGATSNQFTGTSSRSPSRRQSPSPSLFRRHFSRSHPPERPDTDISSRPAMIQDLQGPLEVSVQSSDEISVQVRSATPESQISYNPSQSSVSSIRGQTPSPSPSVSDTHRSVHQGTVGSIQASSHPSINASPEPALASPEPYVSRISLQVPVPNAPGTESGPRNRWIRLMHPDQVSRYVKKGDV